MEQEFVIIGWRPSDKPRRPFSLAAARRCARRASCAMPGGSAAAIRASGWTISRRNSRQLERKTLAGRRRAAGDRAACAFPRAEAGRARSRFAAGPATTWCGRARSRDCAPTSLRPRSSGSTPCRRRKAVKRAKAEVRRRRRSAAGASAQQPRKSHGDDGRRVRRRPRHPSRPRAVRGAGRHQARPDRLLPVGGRPDPAACRGPAAVAWCAARRAAAANAFSRSTPRRGFPDEFGHIRIKEKSGTREYLYHRGRARAGRGGAGRRARTARLGLAHAIRWRSRTAWCSISIPTKGCRSRGCATRRRTCASG